MSRNIDNLSGFEKDILLQWFLYHLPMGSYSETPDMTLATRCNFKTSFPAIYNKLAGREIVKVTKD